VRAALGVAEAEAGFADGVIDEDDDGGGARAALRSLGVRNADPRFAAALAHERAHFDKQARSFALCGGWLWCRTLLLHSQLRGRQRAGLLHTATHVVCMGHVVVS